MNSRKACEIVKENSTTNNNVVIRVRNLSKEFKLNSDKPRTIKERLLFFKYKNKVDKIKIL